MNSLCTRRSALTVAFFAAVAFGSNAIAQQAAGAPARILVGFAAGGTFDVVSRILAEKLRDPLNRTVIVDNKAGAGGRLAVDALKSASGDGSTAMLCPDLLTSIYPFVFRKLNYEPEDIRPVSTVADFPMALAVPASSPIKTFAEYGRWLRANPTKANFGHGAPGGPTYFMGLLLGKTFGVPMQDVAYKGAAPMIIDLISGQVAAGTSTVGDFVEHHNGGRIRVLAVSSAQRSPLLPDVPTFTELGHKELTSVGTLAICLPVTASAATIAQWSSAVRIAVSDPTVKEKIRALGFVAEGSSAQEAQTKFNNLRSFWEPVVTASGFKAD